ncbi:MAG: ABC transporter substrate-binding protein [Chloroflexi bacterium]|nr:ABC transporter substrate-binding protein [Chloroflexota bacterium]
MGVKRFWTLGSVAFALIVGCAPAAQQATPAAAPTKPVAAASPAASSAPAAKPSAAAAPVSSPVASTAARPAAKPTGASYSFGVLIPITGPAGSVGETFRPGFEMAIDEINNSGGAANMTLEANVQDHKGTAQGGVEAMNQLVNIGKVPYVISTFSSVTLASQPIAAQNKVVLINAGGTDTSLLGKPWLYNDQVMAQDLLPPLAAFGFETGKKAAMFTSNDAYGDGSRKVFRDSWEKLGGQIVGDELFPLDATDWSAGLNKIKATNPDVVMIVAVGQTQGRLIKQARALGVPGLYVGPLSSNDAINAGGDATEGFVDAGIAIDPNTTDPDAKRFIDTYRQKYGGEVDWPAGTMYESTYLLRDLIEAVVKDGGDPRSGDALLKALQAKGEFKNYLAGGIVRFKADQSVARAIALRKVDHGKFTVVRVIQPGP